MMIYKLLESVIGRQLSWRIGRFIYLGARRELLSDPSANGEYALIRWIINASKSFQGAMTDENSAEGIVSFIDVGANLGAWSRKVFDEFEKSGCSGQVRIEIFEPAPTLHASICTEFAAEIARGAAGVHRLALADKVGRSRFILTGARTGTSALATEVGAPVGEEIDVEVSTLDDMAEQLAIKEILLIKIDAEGADFNVISGCAQLLNEGRVKVVQFEYNWRWIAFGHWLRSVFRFIENRNYVLGLLTQDGIETHDEWHPELERYTQTNYVLVRNDILPRLPHRRVAFTTSNAVEAVDSLSRKVTI